MSESDGIEIHIQEEKGSENGCDITRYRSIVACKPRPVMRRFFDRLMDFIFPQHLICHCCDREAVVNEYGICRSCEEKLKFAVNAGLIPNIDGFAAGLLYEEPAASALRSFKYNGMLCKKEFFVHYMRIPADWEFDYVLAVPLHPDRERKRGFNQSEVLAAEICKQYGLVLGVDFLKRNRNTPKQARLSGEERRKNVKGAFSASEDCCGKAFMLIDDMRTTGGTLSECALALKKNGAVRVYALTACCASFRSPVLSE